MLMTRIVPKRVTRGKQFKHANQARQRDRVILARQFALLEYDGFTRSVLDLAP